MKISAKLTGAGNIQQGIRRVGAALPGVTADTVGGAMQAAAKETVPYQGGNSYAVQPAPGGYVRTGNLGRSCYVEQEGQTYRFVAEAYNRQGGRYETYVIGDQNGQRQRWPWWPRAAEVFKRRLAELTVQLDRAIAQLMQQEGLGR